MIAADDKSPLPEPTLENVIERIKNWTNNPKVWSRGMSKNHRRQYIAQRMYAAYFEVKAELAKVRADVCREILAEIPSLNSQHRSLIEAKAEEGKG